MKYRTTRHRIHIWTLQLDGLRLRLAFHLLPERFRTASAALWVSEMNKEAAQIEAHTREINELTEELRRKMTRS